MQIVFAWITQYGYPVLFCLLVFGIVGLPVPDETLLTFCGYLIYKGRLHYGFTFLAAFLGSASGISLSYFLGLRYGKAVLTRWGKFVHLTPERIAQIENRFDRIGPGLLTVGYFVPGVRHFTALVAGLSGLPKYKFALFAYLGALLWVATFLTIGYKFGDEWQHTSETIHHYLLIALGILIVAAAIIWLIRHRLQWKDRR